MMRCKCQNCNGTGRVTCDECDGEGFESTSIQYRNIPRLADRYCEFNQGELDALRELQQDAKLASVAASRLAEMRPKLMSRYKEQLADTLHILDQKAGEIELAARQRRAKAKGYMLLKTEA